MTLEHEGLEDGATARIYRLKLQGLLDRDAYATARMRAVAVVEALPHGIRDVAIPFFGLDGRTPISRSASGREASCASGAVERRLRTMRACLAVPEARAVLTDFALGRVDQLLEVAEFFDGEGLRVGKDDGWTCVDGLLALSIRHVGRTILNHLRDEGPARPSPWQTYVDACIMSDVRNRTGRHCVRTP